MLPQNLKSLFNKSFPAGKKKAQSADTQPSSSVSAVKSKKGKTDVHRWLSISLDILEQHLFDIVIKPFLTGFGVIFVFGALITVTLLITINILFSQNFALLSDTGFISTSYIFFLSISVLLIVIVHSLTSRQRFNTIHEIIPHQKRHSQKVSLLLFLTHDLTFISLFSVCAVIISFFQFPFYYTALLISTALLLIIYRTILRYVIPLIVFEDYTYIKAVQESVKVFLTSEIKIVNHTLIPMLAIFGLGIISTSLVERINNTISGLVILLIYIGIYCIYYFFFGFTIDYLAFIYARIKKRIEPKVYKKKQLKPTDTVAIGVSIILIIILPLSIFFGITRAGQTAVASTREAIITNKLQNERPIVINSADSVDSQSTSQPFSAKDTVSYRGLEFSVNSFSFVQIENQGFANICLLDITIKNFQADTYEFFPHLTINVVDQSQNTKIPHYLDSKVVVNDENVLNSYSKYLVPEGLSLKGSVAFDCSNLSKDADVRVEYNMARINSEAENANLNIDQYLDFERQSMQAIYKYSTVSVVIAHDSFNSRNISQSLPVKLTFDSVEIISALESRFCRVHYTLNNDWSKPLDVEFYMTTLTDSAQGARAQAYIDENYNPKNLKTSIPPLGSQAFTQDFNCQDGGNSYTLTFTPYADFGPYVSQQSITTPVIVQ